MLKFHTPDFFILSDEKKVGEYSIKIGYFLGLKIN